MRLNIFKEHSTHWQDVSVWENPLEHELLTLRRSHLVEQGRLSPSAAAKVAELLRIFAPLALREPTEADIAEFWLLRNLDGI